LKLEVSNHSIISNLTKDRYHALAFVVVLKKEKLSLEVNDTKLLEKLETLDKDHKSRVSLQFFLSQVVNLEGKFIRRNK
jgi:hypothetical protein